MCACCVSVVFVFSVVVFFQFNSFLCLSVVCNVAAGSSEVRLFAPFVTTEEFVSQSFGSARDNTVEQVLRRAQDGFKCDHN